MLRTFCSFGVMQQSALAACIVSSICLSLSSTFHAAYSEGIRRKAYAFLGKCYAHNFLETGFWLGEHIMTIA